MKALYAQFVISERKYIHRFPDKDPRDNVRDLCPEQIAPLCIDEIRDQQHQHAGGGEKCGEKCVAPQFPLTDQIADKVMLADRFLWFC